MDSSTAAGVWTNIETDTRSVFTGGQQLDWGVIVSDAEQLLTRYTPQTGTATLDALHVAAARSLGAQTFISFDGKQRELAKLVGLTVLD